VSNVGASALQVDDRVVSVNGMRIISAIEIFYKMDNSLTKEGPQNDERGDHAVYEFVVIRNGEKVTLPNVMFSATPNERGGMTYDRDFFVKPVEKSFGSLKEAAETVGNVLSYSVRSAVSVGRHVWLLLFDIIRGTYGLNEISGPIGIAELVSQVTKQAANFKEVIMSIVWLSSIITINLGIFNLLPIPALDGGRLVFLGIEAIRRKPLKAEVEGIVHFVGFALLIVLIIVVAFSDVRRLIFGA